MNLLNGFFLVCVLGLIVFLSMNLVVVGMLMLWCGVCMSCNGVLNSLFVIVCLFVLNGMCVVVVSMMSGCVLIIIVIFSVLLWDFVVCSICYRWLCECRFVVSVLCVCGIEW